MQFQLFLLLRTQRGWRVKVMMSQHLTVKEIIHETMGRVLLHFQQAQSDLRVLAGKTPSASGKKTAGRKPEPEASWMLRDRRGRNRLSGIAGLTHAHNTHSLDAERLPRQCARRPGRQGYTIRK